MADRQGRKKSPATMQAGLQSGGAKSKLRLSIERQSYAERFLTPSRHQPRLRTTSREKRRLARANPSMPGSER
jgi:hypothetical protein